MKHPVGAVAVVALSLVVSSCTLLSPRHDPSRFYTLAARSSGGVPGSAGPSVVVGPVALPAYLDRNEIAVRVSPNELTYAQNERWAEPLVQNFTRVLVEDLGTALGSDRVATITTAPTLIPDYRIEVVVVRFEAGPDGSAQLTARWAVRDGAGKIQRIKQTQHQRQATGATTEGGVHALSAALADLADEMASVVRELGAERAQRAERS